MRCYTRRHTIIIYTNIQLLYRMSDSAHVCTVRPRRNTRRKDALSAGAARWGATRTVAVETDNLRLSSVTLFPGRPSEMHRFDRAARVSASGSAIGVKSGQLIQRTVVIIFIIIHIIIITTPENWIKKENRHWFKHKTCRASFPSTAQTCINFSLTRNSKRSNHGSYSRISWCFCCWFINF